MRIEFTDRNGVAGIVTENLTVAYDGIYDEQIKETVAAIDDGFKWRERAPPENLFEKLSTALPQRAPVEEAGVGSGIEEEMISLH